MPNLISVTHPYLREEFLYCLDKNGNKDKVKTFNMLHTGSRYSAIWKCSKTNCVKNCEHRYKAVIRNRTQKKPRGCPYCSRRKVCQCNSFAIKQPELLKEWGDDNVLKPTEISEKSGKKIRWECKKSECVHNHTWIATPHRRVLMKCGCPYCSGQYVCECNSFSKKQPELTKEWGDDNLLKPTEIAEKSSQIIQWKCLKSQCNHHRWYVRPSDRVSKNTGCPYCSHRKFCECYCLASEFPDLLNSEWDEQKNDEENLDVFQLGPNSDKHAWWICKICQFSWKTTIRFRTSRRSGCPKCNHSKMEETMFNLLTLLQSRNLIKSVKTQWRLMPTRLFADFMIALLNNKQIILEMDGEQHFKPCDFGSKSQTKEEMFAEVQNNDQRKKEWCEANNIPLLRISYIVKPEHYEAELLDFINTPNVIFRLVHNK